LRLAEVSRYGWDREEARCVIRFNGQAALDNRTLAASGLAGVRPTNISAFETLRL
jgi:hypothetical protein